MTMKHGRALRRSAVLLAGTLTLAACGGGRNDETPAAPVATDGASGAALHLDRCEGGYQPTKGVTATSIKLGQTAPLTGPLAVLAGPVKGAKAFFAYANAELGGVHGRKIELVTKDDGYDPSRTQSMTGELLQKDGVFGLFGVLGTANNLAVWDDLEAQCVPNLFALSPSARLGDEKGHPWTVNASSTSANDAAAFAEYLKTRGDVRTVALLNQNDDFGKGYAAALKKALAGSGITIVEEETYLQTDPDVRTQITNLAATGADVFSGGIAGVKCAQALKAIQASGWEPAIVLPPTCAAAPILALTAPGGSQGMVSSTILKDPTNPQWADDPQMKLYEKKAAQYNPGVDVDDPSVALGWTVAAVAYQTLKDAPALTRAEVMATARNLDGVSVGLLLPDITYRTGPGDPFSVESVSLIRYDQKDKLWDFIDSSGNPLPAGKSAAISSEGRTGRLVG
jgi:branched-chain amino acid transport system substrate-binding protein